LQQAVREVVEKKKLVTKFWLFRWLALLLLAWASYWAARLAWADHLGTSDTIAGRERAVRLAPYSASLWEHLADKREETGGNPLPDLEQAARLDPANSRRFERLGQRAELSADFILAEKSLLRAAELSRLYQPRYLLSQFYFRRQNLAEWKRWSEEALATAYGDITPLLDLMWRIQPDADALARQGVQQKPAIARQFLLFLLRNRPAAAMPLAQHIAETGNRDDLPVLYRYCDVELAQAKWRAPLLVWNTICQRKLLPCLPLDPTAGTSLTNGDFAHRAAAAGFDWHIEPGAGIQASQHGNGLHIVLSGNQADRSLIGWRYVPLRSGATYRLHVAGESEGLGWSVFSPSTSGWRETVVDPDRDFQAPAELVRLALMYRGSGGTPQVSAELTLRDVRLEMAP
jgi:hypothetical protein